MKLVHNLQEDALNPNISVSDLLRKAYAVATKLNLPNFEQWIYNELNGYSKKENDIPEYRFITGILRACNPLYGWCDVNVNDVRLVDMLGHIPVIDKISEVEQLSKLESEIYRQLPPEMNRNFMKANLGMKHAIIFPKQQFFGILDSVKTNLLYWALSLEKKGILGEDMNFNETERTAAQSITINNFVGSVSNAPMQQGIKNTMTIESHKNDDIDTVKILVAEIKKIIDDMPRGEEKETIQADIESVECQLKSPKPKMGTIKELFNSIRNILEGTFGSLIASHPVIANAFEKLFG